MRGPLAGLVAWGIRCMGHDALAGRRRPTAPTGAASLWAWRTCARRWRCCRRPGTGSSLPAGVLLAVETGRELTRCPVSAMMVPELLRLYVLSCSGTFTRPGPPSDCTLAGATATATATDVPTTGLALLVRVLRGLCCRAGQRGRHREGFVDTKAATSSVRIVDSAPSVRQDDQPGRRGSFSPHTSVRVDDGLQQRSPDGLPCPRCRALRRMIA